MCRMSTEVGRFVLLCLLTPNALWTQPHHPLTAAPYTNNAAGHATYVIAACPIQTGDARFPATLYSISPNALDPIRLIVSKGRGTSFVRPYYYERVVVIGEAEPDQAGHAAFAIIRMDSPSASKSIELSYPPGFTILQCYLFSLSPFEPKIGCEITREAQEYQLIGQTLNGGTQESLPWEVLSESIISGMPGGGLEGGDFLYVAADAHGRLVTRITKTKSVSLGLTLAVDMQIPPKDNLVMCVNNHYVSAILAASNQRTNASGAGESRYFLFNKRDRKWETLIAQGARTFLRGFGEWLAGAVADPERGTPSPGTNSLRKERTPTGVPADLRFGSARIYLPGMLFIYNVNTKRKILFSTGQGDSEVLLVDAETIYYRVNDSIFQARIGVDGLKEIKSLVHAPAVADVHWAFIGPSAPRKTEK